MVNDKTVFLRAASCGLLLCRGISPDNGRLAAIFPGAGKASRIGFGAHELNGLICCPAVEGASVQGGYRKRNDDLPDGRAVCKGTRTDVVHGGSQRHGLEVHATAEHRTGKNRASLRKDNLLKFHTILERRRIEGSQRCGHGQRFDAAVLECGRTELTDGCRECNAFQRNAVQKCPFRDLRQRFGKLDGLELCSIRKYLLAKRLDRVRHHEGFQTGAHERLRSDFLKLAVFRKDDRLQIDTILECIVADLLNR